MEKPWSLPSSLKTDCRSFRGDVPCWPHKTSGVHCIETDGTACAHYQRTSSNILIIKLGAIGDVIRTTPILHALKALHPEARFWWLTLSPEVVPSLVDVILPFTARSLATLEGQHFDILINLDKDLEACSLATHLSARVKKGFVLSSGKPAPADNDAVHKFMTGVFDDLSRENRKSYLQEIFEVCGLTFSGERYILDAHRDAGYLWHLPKKKKIVGLNTGCGGRWITRLWPEKSWISLARRVKRAGYVPLFLGGEQEDVKNRKLARQSGGIYLGHFPLPRFINLVDQCELVVTAVTMAMHITIGLGKKIVLFNNIFNKLEFELYGLGEIIEPPSACTCFYAPRCTHPDFAPLGCMETIRVDTVFSACTKLLRSHA
jgi:ADP-heptose:LPS heptosyltransferase